MLKYNPYTPDWCMRSMDSRTNLALRFVEAVTQNVDFLSQPGLILLCSCEINAKGVSLAMLLV